MKKGQWFIIVSKCPKQIHVCLVLHVFPQIISIIMQNMIHLKKHWAKLEVFFYVISIIFCLLLSPLDKGLTLYSNISEYPLTTKVLCAVKYDLKWFSGSEYQDSKKNVIIL